MSHNVPASVRIAVCLFAIGAVFAGFVPPVYAAGEVWTFVDGNLSTGLNYDTARHAVDPAMAVHNNELYVAWTENNSSPTTQIRVRKYNGSTWSWVDGGSTTGINYNTAESAFTPQLMVFNSNLYAIWSELYSGASVTRVKRYDGGSTWTSIDGSATNGLNFQSVTSSNPSLGISNGVLYATWTEAYGGCSQLRVKRYESGTSWTFVDGGGYTGLNYDTTKNANKPHLLALNNVFYLIWTETNASSKNIIRVKRYDGGSTWTTVDGGSGLNYNSGNTVDRARLIVYNNSLYAYWLENYIVRMKSYNGSAWSTADGNMGFRQNALNYIYSEGPPAAIPYGNRLYFTWGEDISYDPWSIQTRAAYYTPTSMTFIDGDDWTTGLNYNRLQYAYKQAIVDYNGLLYVAWFESSGTANQLRVRSTPLSASPIANGITVPANGWYTAGQNLDFTVTFTEPVNVTGTPVIPLTFASGAVNASYLSGSGTATLAFRYTVAAGNLDADGIAVGTSISLNGGTIRDTVHSLDAGLALIGVPSATGVLVDAVAPTRTSTSPADGATGVTVSQNLIISFSESIAKGTGNVVVRRTVDDSVVETIGVSAANVTVSANSATIDPSVTLAESTGYYVLIDAGAFKDVAGNGYGGISAKTTWDFVTVDTQPPAGYTVSIDQPYVNNNNKTAMSFTFAGAEVGTTYDYALTSTGGGTPVTGSGTITGATQQVSGVNTFSLNEGTLTLSVTLTDASANTGAAATDTVVKDTLMPSGYAVSIDQAGINLSNQAAMSFLVSGAETGTSYAYSIASSGGGTPVTGSGTVASGSTASVSGLDTTGLGDGILTVSLTMTDVPGNPGMPVTDTVIKDTAAPSGYTVSIDQASIDAANETAMSFTFAGAEAGTTYSFSISSSGGWSPVTGSGSVSSVGETVSGIDVSGLNRGTLTLSMTLTDAAGNTGVAATDAVFKNSAPPTSFYTLAPCRLVDTRNAAGPYGGPALAANGERVFTLVGQCGIPANVAALSVNVTATGATQQGWLLLYPAGETAPSASTVNYAAGRTRANNAFATLNGLGQLAVKCGQSAGTVHMVLDVNGYFQ